MRKFVEDYYLRKGIELQKIKNMLDQDIPRFEETTKYVKIFINKEDNTLDISKEFGWEGIYGIYLKSLGYNIVHFGNNDVRFKFDIPDNTYNAVLALELFEHINPLSNRDDYRDLMREARFFLKECNRILQHGGYLILTTPNVTDYFHIRALIEGNHPYYLNHFREFTPNMIDYELRQAGFKVKLINTIVNDNDIQIEQLIKQLGKSIDKRGKHIIAVAVKID